VTDEQNKKDKKEQKQRRKVSGANENLWTLKQQTGQEKKIVSSQQLGTNRSE